MTNDAGNGREQQQRELEEIRRSFQEIGVKVGSMFEPAQHNGAGTDKPPPAPATTAESATPARPTTPLGPRLVMGWPVRVLVPVLAVVCLLLGGGLGYLLHRPTAASSLPTATSPPTATSVVTRVVPGPQTRSVAPPACLQTAQRGDELIDLFTRNIRDRRLSLALKNYTLASQACRKEASP
jgi:hypothetical protein